MPESALSVSYDELQLELGRFLGYNPDPNAWSAEQTSEVDRYIQTGVKQFYYPPAIEGAEAGYEWSFLAPIATINLTQGVGVQDLPDDLGRVVGDFHFDPETYSYSVTQVSEHRIQTLLQRADDENRPRHAAIRYKSSDGSDGQRLEVVWWPIPETDYTLTYRYEAYTGKLIKTTNPYPLGGMKNSELVMESCLAVAEQRANDEKGMHWDSFTRMLISAIAYDRRNGARYFGAMYDGENLEVDARRERLRSQSNYPITYKGETF